MTPVTMSKDDAATLPADMAALAATLITVTLWGSAFVGIRAAVRPSHLAADCLATQ